MSMDQDDFQDPPAKKRKLMSLGKGKSKRFASPLKEKDMKRLSEAPIPANTAKNTQWALRAFCEWRKERNKRCLKARCPDNLLKKPSAENLNLWLSLFVVEARRSDGARYPSTTLYQLMSGLLRYARAKSKECPNFLDKKDVCFAELHGTCESVSRELRQSGVGAQVKHAAVIEPVEEEQLWESGAIGIYSPRVLVRCVFYYVGKAFCLRGGQEQRDLKPSQFIREYEPDRYTYVENGSKNHQGGFGTKRQSNKVVTIYANPDAVPRCVVYLLDFLSE